MSVIDRIRKLSKEKGISLSFICKKMNVARVYFIDCEKNNRTIPDDKLAIIAECLFTTVDELKGKKEVLSLVNLLKIKDCAQQKGWSMSFLCEKLEISRNYFTDVKNGKTTISPERLQAIAALLDTTTDYLCDKTDKKDKEPDVTPNAVFLGHENVHMIPLYESASAGLGAYADNTILDYVPCYITSKFEAEQTICIKVQGNSMAPKIEDGDIIQVHRQKSVDSGTIAVVLLDGDDGLVKKVNYGNDWIELVSLNQNYPPMRFEGADVQKVQVVGKVNKIIKSV